MIWVAGVPSERRKATARQFRTRGAETRRRGETRKLTVRLIALHPSHLLPRIHIKDLRNGVRESNSHKARIKSHGRQRSRNDPLSIRRDLLSFRRRLLSVRLSFRIQSQVSPARYKRSSRRLGIPDFDVSIRTRRDETTSDERESPNGIRVTDEGRDAGFGVVVGVELVVGGGEFPDADRRVLRTGVDSLLRGGDNDRSDSMGVASVGDLRFGVLRRCGPGEKKKSKSGSRSTKGKRRERTRRTSQARAHQDRSARP